jgi:Ca-activated chloride channel family protein
MTTEIAPLEGLHAAEPDAGLGALVTSRGNLPLDAVDVRAAIAGTSARVELTQEFRNPFDVPLEATYIFRCRTAPRSPGCGWSAPGTSWRVC